MNNRQETLQEGIARLGSTPHTVITRFLEHYLTQDIEHRVDSFQWIEGKVKVVGDLLQYDGPAQELLPQYTLKKNDNVLLLNFNASEVAHPEYLPLVGPSVHEPMKYVLEKIAWDNTGRTDFIVAASWERLMDSLIQLAPRFSVVGLVDDGYAKHKLLKEAANTDPRIWEKAIMLGHFPVVAIHPIDLYESVTGREFPDMGD